MIAIIHYVLALLEGGLAGGYFYCAGQEEEKERKVLLYVISALWFLSSLMNSMTGGREWKKWRESRAVKVIEREEEIEGEYEDE